MFIHILFKCIFTILSCDSILQGRTVNKSRVRCATCRYWCCCSGGERCLRSRASRTASSGGVAPVGSPRGARSAGARDEECSSATWSCGICWICASTSSPSCTECDRELPTLSASRARQLETFSLFIVMSPRARKIVTKFHNYSYEIVMSPVIVNSYKNGHNSYQIVK